MAYQRIAFELERIYSIHKNKNKKKSVALVRERTLLTEYPPLIGEVSANFVDRRCRVVSATDPHGRILDRIYSIDRQVNEQRDIKQ
jgi:hypothetical protein